MESGDWPAVRNAETALQRGERDPDLSNLAAWGCLRRGETDTAIAILEAALEFAPSHVVTLANLAGLLRQKGRLRDAILLCDRAIAADRDSVQAWLERAFVLDAARSSDNARISYSEVIRIDPSCAAALAGLASLAAREGNVDEGRNVAERALAIEPGNFVAAAALATIELESGQAARAKTVLESILSDLDQPSADRSLALNLLGDAHAKLRETADAFAAYAQSKADFRDIHKHMFVGQESSVAPIEAIIAGITVHEPTLKRALGKPQPVNSAANHLFLLGYPRSGNTLCENILASLPGVVAIEERPTLDMVDHTFPIMADGAAKFAKADEVVLNRLRRAYWDKVEATGLSVRNRCLVDMDPLKSLRLPVIARLFPEARVIIMRRDPRDVVWSCFRSNFALSNAAMAFTTLESTARHYDAVMRLTEAALALLPIKAHVVRYDSLVREFEQCTRTLCEFAGLQWSQQLIRFDHTARTRGVTTASAKQVRKPLYDGTRQWEPYARYLAEVMPTLAPWVERFGY